MKAAREMQVPTPNTEITTHLARAGRDSGARIAGASVFLIFFATLPLAWVTLSYDCGPSEDVTGFQLVTGYDVSIKGSKSNVMIGYDETPIDGAYRQSPSIRMMMLFSLIALSFAAIFREDGGYLLRAAMGALATLTALSFFLGTTGMWVGRGPPPNSDGAWGPLAAFVVFTFAAIVNARMAHLLAERSCPPNLFLRAAGFSVVVTMLLSVMALALLLLVVVLTSE